MKFFFIKLLTFIILSAMQLSCKINLLEYFMCEPSYSLSTSYFSANDTKQLYLSYGYNRESPQRYFYERFINIGFGEIWHGKANDYLLNFKLLDLQATIAHLFVKEEINEHTLTEDYGWYSHLSRLNIGMVLIDYNKNFLNDRKMNWIGISVAFIFDKRTTQYGGCVPPTISPPFSPQALLYQFIGVSNIRYGDYIGKMGNPLKNNNLGIESKSTLQIGILFSDNLFVGMNCSYNLFFSNLYPFSEILYGGRINYSFQENKQLSVLNLCDRGFNIYFDFINCRFEHLDRFF